MVIDGPEGRAVAGFREDVETPPAYRSARALSRWLVGVLLVGLALNVAVSGLQAVAVFRYPDFLDPEAEVAHLGELAAALGFLLAAVAYLLVFASSVALFCAWIHRANRNARALGARGMEFTPGWAVGWFFVPIANLFKPYQAVREVYQASDPDTGEPEQGPGEPARHWSDAPVPAQLRLWWLTWILVNLIDNAGLRYSFGDDAASQATSAWLGLAGAAVALPCTLLAVWVILEIQERQERRAARRAGPSPATLSAAGPWSPLSPPGERGEG